MKLLYCISVSTLLLLIVIIRAEDSNVTKTAAPTSTTVSQAATNVTQASGLSTTPLPKTSSVAPIQQNASQGIPSSAIPATQQNVSQLVPSTGVPLVQPNTTQAPILNVTEQNASTPKPPVLAGTNDTSHEVLNNATTVNNTIAAVNETNTTSTEVLTPGEPVLPEKGSAEEERNSSIAIFFVLCVLALGILLIHLMLLTHFQYLPESITVVFLGALIGFLLNLMNDQNIANWRKEEAFSPTAFFLVLLPPIIFESGYNLHKGNFFQNIGSILVFAILGTTISALVIGAGVYILGLAEITYKLSFVESFAFGSLISAVDPVATVAIFHALDIDPVLNMLVFGESILNDAIAIVLTTSILRANSPDMSTSEAVLTGINQFVSTFFASAGIGVLFALTSALLLKYVDLRKNPSLEFGMMLVFTYAPYALAEGIHLSGEYEFNNDQYYCSYILLHVRCRFRNHGYLVQWYRHVALHALQSVHRHADYDAADDAYSGLHRRNLRLRLSRISVIQL
jgi:sodium/hydrogen exchanger 8